MRRTVRIALFAAVAMAGSALLTVLAAEAALAYFDVWPGLTSDYMLTCNGCRRPHRDLIVAAPELLKPERYESPSQTRIILSIGDSFTEGSPGGYTKSYPVELERLLVDAGQRVRVINAGQGDSGPDQQHRLLETVILPKTRPSVVIWQFYFNDIGNNHMYPTYDLDSAERLQPLDARINWLYLRQASYEAIPLRLEWKRGSRFLRLAIRGFEYFQGREAPGPEIEVRERWARDKIRAEVASFHRLAEERGFRPYVVLVVPQACYVPAPDIPDELKLWTLAQELTQEIRASLADSPGFIEIYLPDEDPSRLFTTDETAISPWGERHFSPQGYKSMAAMIAQRILADDRALGSN